MRPVPGFLKLVLVKRSLFNDEASGAWWKSPFQYEEVAYIYRGSVPAISCVKVGRTVFPEVDVYDDAVEPAEFRHLAS